MTQRGRVLEIMMAERGLSQRQLAEQAGVSGSVISLFRRGKSRMNDESAAKVAEALGVEVSELIGRRPAKSEESEGSMRLVAGQRALVHYPEGLEPGSSTDAEGASRQDGAEQATRPPHLPPGTVSVAGLLNRRSFLGLSQADLARRAGLHTNTLRRAEQSGRSSEQTASALARVLSVSVADLAEAEQGRFPKKKQTATSRPSTGMAMAQQTPTRDTASASSTDEDQAEPAAAERPAPLRLEVAEPVLRRVDRVLDIVEMFARRRRDG